jgi:5-methylcytosine-specific restriction protein A
MANMPPKVGRVRIEGAQRLDPADYGEAAVDYETVRGSSASRGYGGRWRKARETVLRREPLCRPSQLLLGKDVAADVLDHWYPHCGLSWLFWTQGLWVPMSKGWHDGPKQEIEARGEPALDRFAADLRVPILSGLEPRRIWEWRGAFAAREHRPMGGI